MSFDYSVLDLNGITALPTKVKEQFPEKSKIWEALTKNCIGIWEREDEKYLQYNGKRYKLTEVNK